MGNGEDLDLATVSSFKGARMQSKEGIVKVEASYKREFSKVNNDLK